MRHFLIPLLCAAALAACSSDTRYGFPTPAPEERVASRYGELEILQVTLPSYGSSEEIYIRKADGKIEPLGPLWADDPIRAVTLQVARDLGQITGAVAAPSPWPFRDLPDARVDVRIEEFLATDDGTFLLTGQYFVAPESGARNRAKRFSISVPLVQPPTPGAIVSARGAAVSRLALDIARTGL
ncbi:PqiC family protein [Marinibacterium sp. SX1]|uniref:PqiC family protein n=1 Tax=Marinibacterium sp. SX1 TaxID=3388424 RepID=UPI003D17E8E5